MSDKRLPAKEYTGDVQSLDIELSNKIEAAFRIHTPNFIDWHPLDKNRRDHLARLNQYVVKPNEKVDAVQAVKIANTIVSECQLDCDTKWGGALRPREQIYQVLIIDEHRGGYAKPAATHHIALLPQISRPAPAARDGDEEDSPITATSMLERAYNKIQDGDQASREAFFEAAGDILLTQKNHIDKLFVVVHDLIGDIRAGQKERAEDLRAQRHDLAELQTVAIESKVADEDIADRRAKRGREHMLTDFAADTLKDARTYIGPFVGELFADMFGKNPQLTDGKEPKQINGKTNGETKPGDVGPSEERTIVTEILTEIENLGLGEFLFGLAHVDGDVKVIDKPGVFTKEQADLLLGASEGTVAPDALYALVPDSGNPLAFTIDQGKLARARMPFHLLAKVMKLLAICKRRHGDKPNGEANA